MLFISFSNVDVKFAKKDLTWNLYSVSETLPTIKRVQLIDRKEFAAVALDLDKEAFVVQVACL